MQITDNRLFAKKQSCANVGIYAWNQKAASCDRVEVRGNTVGWTNKDGVANPCWDGGNCGAIRLSGDDFKSAYQVPGISKGGPHWAQPADF
ncbi:hypothetical protein [Comamonas endophytica]|uniref:Parallel beta helix pectate lyase-like protein n=1 Tax=Comamonas endophytica TaxID=2949090 RepID=A0ABY6GFA3_9BURK|nr:MULTISPECIES: hypothetical protein [unclassified Acidovorax]MCD2513446.1 hypothetical protein [Acidovorax sp. D4N7]UYG53772.1 hypothetical protein M9799_17715 [Acidovorax sp. 5MLIR]